MSAERIMDAIRDDMARRMDACGFVIENEVKSRTPVDTGRLRASISHKSDEDGAVVGTNLNYAGFVELGTRKQNAQPHLVPGIVAAKSSIKRILGA